MPLRERLRAVVALALLAAAPAAGAPAAPANPPAHRTLPPALAAHCRAREATTTLRARFDQVRVLAAIGEEERSRGVVMYRKPDALRWEYVEPDRSWTVMTGKEGWAVFPDIRQVQRFVVDQNRRDGVLAIAGFGRCGERFADSFDFETAPAPGGGTVVSMKPLRPEMAASFSRIEMTLDAKDHLPRKIVLHESSGDSIRLELHDLERGVRLDRTLFEPNLPEGYTVVQ